MVKSIIESQLLDYALLQAKNKPKLLVITFVYPKTNGAIIMH